MKKQLLISLFTLSTVLVSCSGIQKRTEIVRQKPLKEIVFLFTNAAHGFLEPDGCGCRQQGGLAKRAGLISETGKKEKALLVFDTGNIFAGPNTVMNKEKTVYILIALNKMGIDALNIGAYDAVQSRFLKQKEERLAFPLISANIKSTLTRTPVFKPYVIKKIQNIKIGIFGLTGNHPTPKILEDENIFIDTPVTAAKKTVNKLKTEGCDIIILLSQLTDRENENIANQVSGIHFILGSSSGKVQNSPASEGRPAILSPGPEGKKAGIIKTFPVPEADCFYDIETKKAVERSIERLKEKERDPAYRSLLEDIVLKKTLMENRLSSFKNNNRYVFEVIPLNSIVNEDSRIDLLIEKYKQSRLKKTLPDYRDNISSVDLSGLSEDKRLLALRLLNELKCYSDINIASSAGLQPFCRKLASIIVSMVTKGESEGKVRYRILQEKEQHKKFLDKGPLFQ